MMSNSEHQATLEAIQDAQARLISLLETAAGEQDWRPEAGRWSFRCIAGHLATTERECFLERVQRILGEENPGFAYYDNTGWDFSQRDLREWLEEWTVTRREIVDTIQEAPEEAWMRRATHETRGEMKLEDILESMAEHDEEHIQEVEANLEEYRSKKG